jgi:hypothetical protein
MWLCAEAIFTAMKKLLFLGACLLALASQPVMAQAGGADVVLVKIADNGLSLHMETVRGTGKPELLDLTGKEYRETGAATSATQRVIAKLCQEGYILKGSYAGQHSYFTTLIFIKGQ